MGKEYEGAKFTGEQKNKERRHLPNEESKLIKSCKYLSEKGLSPELRGGGYGGNASFRKDDNIYITSSGSNLGELDEKEIVEVTYVSYDDFSCEYNGKMSPSSETILHYMIYMTVPRSMNIKAILHGHCNHIVENAKKLKLPITDKFQDYGTKDLVDEVVKLLETDKPPKVFVLKKHGFFVLGKNMDKARERAENLYNRAQDLNV